ncbi:hypothetical protein [Streptomyces sp. NPDC090112]|uniref:hypothetical protein n=1 Tax=Streptomyces sp. NPDC090112 TaxID=3365949 RepID=UPI00380B7A43
MDSEVGGHLLDRHTWGAVSRDPHDVLAELFRIGLGHSDILPTCPTGQASSDVTRSCGRPSLDHYLEILLVKPGAFAGASALAQARAEGGFTKTHEAFWAAAKKKRGDREGTRQLIEVLLLHRQLPAHAVVAGMAVVVRIGSISTDLVAIEARKAIEDTEETDLHPHGGTEDDGETVDQESGDPADEGAKVISLNARRLPSDARSALPDMSKYDRLLMPVKNTATTRKGSSA